MGKKKKNYSIAEKVVFFEMWSKKVKVRISHFH